MRNVEALPSEVDGMIFMYEIPSQVTFVADDTLIPLDVWWFGPEGVLLTSDQMRPCLDSVCDELDSPGPISSVLETPAGEYRFSVGATLSTGENG